MYKCDLPCSPTLPREAAPQKVTQQMKNAPVGKKRVLATVSCGQRNTLFPKLSLSYLDRFSLIGYLVAFFHMLYNMNTLFVSPVPKTAEIRNYVRGTREERSPWGETNLMKKHPDEIPPL